MLTIVFVSPISDYIASYFGQKQELVINPGNKYTKDKDYLFVQASKDYTPYSYQDILNIFYSSIDHKWETFTFYCPAEYTKCLKDVEKISGDDLILTHLNNYVHPFNSFTNINTSISDDGEITLTIEYLYNDEQIAKIDKKTDEILSQIVNDDMELYDKLKAIHDYIINNSKYDIERNNKKDSNFSSYTAYGPLFDGYATCNGYTDLMAIFLTKLGLDNYKIATTSEEITYDATGHIWNAVFYDNNWVHIDLTWDDPVSNDGKDYLFHTYFLVNNEALVEADKGETVVQEHNFNKEYYLEFN